MRKRNSGKRPAIQPRTLFSIVAGAVLLGLTAIPWLSIFVWTIILAITIFGLVKSPRKAGWIFAVLASVFFLIVGIGLTASPSSSNAAKDDQSPLQSSSSKKTKATGSKNTAKNSISSAESPSAAAITDGPADLTGILNQLLSLTDSQLPAENKDYYWENGKSNLSTFGIIKAGEYSFSADEQGRSGLARATLTYKQFTDSKGKRQGEPLDPPAWPVNNPKVAINYTLTGKTYHGYLYNRSHSIGDSLLGAGSYSSRYNFTTGTRPQNIGADQNGGMRAAEERAEKYWKAHHNTKATISYQVTPLYNANETIPRGSVVDLRSSDGELDIELVIVNDVEGFTIDYTSGASSDKSAASPAAPENPVQTEPAAPAPEVPAAAPAEAPVTRDYTSNGGWSTAAPGMVFLKEESGKYYSQVTNPENYTYLTQEEASTRGTRAARGNQYARP